MVTCFRDYISGVKLSDASKKLGKKFATGASVVKVLLHFGSCVSSNLLFDVTISYNVISNNWFTGAN